MQELSVGLGCDVKLGVIVHEMMHVLGIVHEQSRHDRDTFVRIVYENILPGNINCLDIYNFIGRQQNFEKFNENILSTMSVPYDYSSIMHYHQSAFSIAGNPTILTVDPV
jgi:hypothetical protein